MAVTIFLVVFTFAYVPALFVLHRRVITSVFKSKRAAIIFTVTLIALPFVEVPFFIGSYITACNYDARRLISNEGYHPKYFMFHDSHGNSSSRSSISKKYIKPICSYECIQFVNEMVEKEYTTKFVWYFKGTFPDFDQPFDWHHWKQFDKKPIIAPREPGFYAIYPSNSQEHCDAYFEARNQYAKRDAENVFSSINMTSASGRMYSCIAFEPVSGSELAQVSYQKRVIDQGGFIPFTYERSTFVITNDANTEFVSLYSTANIRGPWFLHLDYPANYFCGKSESIKDAINFVGRTES